MIRRTGFVSVRKVAGNGVIEFSVFRFQFSITRRVKVYRLRKAIRWGDSASCDGWREGNENLANDGRIVPTELLAGARGVLDRNSLATTSNL